MARSGMKLVCFPFRLRNRLHSHLRAYKLSCYLSCKKGLYAFYADADSYFAKQDVITDVHELEHFVADHSDQVWTK